MRFKCLSWFESECLPGAPQMVALFWEVVEPLEIGAKKERQLLGGGVSH